MTEPEAFAALIDRHRDELHRHCARRLYRLATNACFDLRARATVRVHYVAVAA